MGCRNCVAEAMRRNPRMIPDPCAFWLEAKICKAGITMALLAL